MCGTVSKQTIKIRREFRNQEETRYIKKDSVPINTDLNMKTNSFEHLSLEEKVDELSEKGVYLMCRQNSIYNIFLYGLGNLYVEVLYFKKNNRIQNIEVASTDKVIDFYLDEMIFEFS